MAYWIVKTNNYNNSKYFHCDFVSDIDKLPTSTSEGYKQVNDTVSSYRCAPGSQCFCHENGSTWFLGSETNQWIKQNVSTGGSGILYSANEPENLSEGMVWIDIDN